jgi:hypothetical protein
MKKYFFLLLFTAISFAQTTGVTKLKITSNPEKTAATRVMVQDATTGEVGYVDKTTISQSIKTTKTVRNQTGSTLTKGTVVYQSGVSGGKLLVAKALASVRFMSETTLGIVENDIPNNTDGNVVTSGTFTGFNTASFFENSTLYLSDVTAGTVTATKPSSPSYGISLGVVTAVGTTGSIDIRIGSAIVSKLDVGLSNVDNTTDANKPISTATQTALNLKANDSEVAKLAGNQIITGSKEFANDITVNGLIIGRGHNNVLGNSVFGFNALMNNTTGSANIAIGFSSLYYNASGDSNLAIGPGALFSNTLGSVNVAIGNASLSNNISGNSNVAIGPSSLGNNQYGYGNIAIGEASGTDSVANITNQNSQIVMGNNSHTNAYIKIGWTVTSDARDKTNFAPVPYGLSFVNSLQPIKYQFKKSRTDSTPVGDIKYGFKAQDILALEGANPVIIDAKDPNNLKYTESNMIPVLVKAIQELSAQVELLKLK